MQPEKPSEGEHSSVKEESGGDEKDGVGSKEVMLPGRFTPKELRDHF